MPKLNLKKELRSLYDAPRTPALVTVPAMNFLMIDGQGDPGGKDYMEAMEALFGMAYTLKFMIKKEGGQDYGVLPLEGLWWSKDMSSFTLDRKEDWLWTSMIMQPDLVTEAHVDRARTELKKRDPAALPKLRFERFEEGLCAQAMHIGPYDAEGPTIQALHSFVEREGYKLRGKHHEVYLGDPRKAAPEKLKTILRHPVEKAQ